MIATSAPGRAPARPRALVTGASSGIGAVFAERLARAGHDLILVARNAERMEALAGKLRQGGGTVEVLAADLTRPAGLRVVEDRVRAEGLDLLVNNAGFGTGGRFADLDLEREEEEIRLNVVALVRLTHAALPGMIARGSGAIINVSSIAGMIPGPGTATYNATKAFVNCFTEGLYEELRGTGVRVQALLPGFTRTEFQQRAEIDASRLPGIAWLSPERVVDGSLAALRRGGGVFCVPSLRYRLSTFLLGLIPRAFIRRVAGIVGLRLFDKKRSR